MAALYSRTSGEAASMVTYADKIGGGQRVRPSVCLYATFIAPGPAAAPLTLYGRTVYRVRRSYAIASQQPPRWSGHADIGDRPNDRPHSRVVPASLDAPNARGTIWGSEYPKERHVLDPIIELTTWKEF